MWCSEEGKIHNPLRFKKGEGLLRMHDARADWCQQLHGGGATPGPLTYGVNKKPATPHQGFGLVWSS